MHYLIKWVFDESYEKCTNNYNVVVYRSENVMIFWTEYLYQCKIKSVLLTKYTIYQHHNLNPGVNFNFTS